MSINTPLFKLKLVLNSLLSSFKLSISSKSVKSKYGRKVYSINLKCISKSNCETNSENENNKIPTHIVNDVFLNLHEKKIMSVDKK